MDLGTIVVWIIVGGIAGWLEDLAVRGVRLGVLGSIIVGILGGVLGGWLFGVLGISLGGGILGSIIAAFVGAVILLLILRAIRRG